MRRAIRSFIDIVDVSVSERTLMGYNGLGIEPLDLDGLIDGRGMGPPDEAVESAAICSFRVGVVGVIGIVVDVVVDDIDSGTSETVVRLARLCFLMESICEE